MVRALYGGTSADVLVRLVEVRPGTTVLAVAAGVPLDVRRADTLAGVTDLTAPPGYVGAAFGTGRARTDSTGTIAFLGPDALTTALEVRAAAVPGASPGAWFRLTGQPPTPAASTGGTGTPTDTSSLVTLAELSARGYQTAGQVDARVQAVVGAAPAALDTLVELARALNNDANYAATVTTALAARPLRADVDAAVAALQQAIAGLVARADAHDTALAGHDRRLNVLEQDSTPPAEEPAPTASAAAYPGDTTYPSDTTYPEA